MDKTLIWLVALISTGLGASAHSSTRYRYSCKDLMWAIAGQHKCIRGDYTDLACAIIKAGTPINQTAWRNETPLIIAARCKSLRVLKCLIDAGALLDMQTTWGSTALMEAASAGSPEAVDMLIAAGADYDRVDHAGRTPLIQAGKIGNESVVCSLCNVGATINSHKEGIKSALYEALRERHYSVVLLLAQRGASIPHTKQCRYFSSEQLRILKSAGKSADRRVQVLLELFEGLYDIPRDLTNLIWDFADCPKSHKPKALWART